MKTMFSATILLLVAPWSLRAEDPKGERSPFSQALKLAQTFAKPAGLAPANDLAFKSLVAAGLKTNAMGEVAFEPDPIAVDIGFLPPRSRGISVGLIPLVQRGSEPKSRRALFPALQLHADLLMTQFDMIAPEHQAATTRLAVWIAKNYALEKHLDIVLLCTTNSGRSVLGASFGRLAAAYHGLDKLKFHCAGNAATAFNPRTVKTLQEIGFEIEKTPERAFTESKKEVNWIYNFKWGTDMAAREFSKKYDDAAMPGGNFAAILICSELDDNCVAARGASIRFAVPYFNPGLYDNSSFETAKYGERRDDIGRFMMCSLAQAAAILRNPRLIPPEKSIKELFDELAPKENRPPRPDAAEPRLRPPTGKENIPKGSFPKGPPPG